MRQATIEVLNKGENVLGSPTAGRYHVQEYEDGELAGGQFFDTLEEADKHVANYIQEIEDDC